MTPERRKFVRLSAPIGVKYSRVRSTKSQTSLSRDISGGGVRLWVMDPLEAGELVELEITLPNLVGQPILAKGEIVWSRAESDSTKTQREIGVKFLDIQPEDLNRLFHYVYSVGINSEL